MTVFQRFRHPAVLARCARGDSFWLAAGLVVAVAVPAAQAQTALTASSPAAPAAETPASSSGLIIGLVELSAQCEAGLMIGPKRPADGLSFSHLFTDHAYQAQLIRPEIRSDHTYTNGHPFNAQHGNNALTGGVDAVVTF